MANEVFLKNYYGFQKPPVGAVLNSAHKLSMGLIGCWLLDEKSGNYLHNIIQPQDVTTSDNIPWIKDGIAPADVGHPDISTTLNHSIGTGKFTVVARLKHASGGSYDTYCGFGAYAPQFFWNNPTTIAIYHGGAINLFTDATPDEIIDVAIVRESTAANKTHGYQNGILRGSTTYSGDITSTAFHIGYSSNASESFNGNIYYLYVYDRALTPDEIKQLAFDPYQIFKHAILIGEAGGGGGLSIPVATYHYMHH